MSTTAIAEAAPAQDVDPDEDLRCGIATAVETLAPIVVGNQALTLEELHAAGVSLGGLLGQIGEDGRAALAIHATVGALDEAFGHGTLTQLAVGHTAQACLTWEYRASYHRSVVYAGGLLYGLAEQLGDAAVICAGCTLPVDLFDAIRGREDCDEEHITFCTVDCRSAWYQR